MASPQRPCRSFHALVQRLFPAPSKCSLTFCCAVCIAASSVVCSPRWAKTTCFTLPLGCQTPSTSWLYSYTLPVFLFGTRFFLTYATSPLSTKFSHKVEYNTLLCFSHKHRSNTPTPLLLHPYAPVGVVPSRVRVFTKYYTEVSGG